MTVVILMMLIFTNLTLAGRKTNLPNSREAHQIEGETSDGTIMVRATGIHKKVNEAKLDAEKAAIYWVIFEQIFNDPSDEARFKKIQEAFFKNEKKKRSIYSHFINYRSGIERRIRSSDKNYRITMTFKVNKKFLEKFFVKKGIIQPRSELANSVGNPTIFVIPDVGGEENLKEVIRFYNTDMYAKQTASFIKEFLTKNSYNVELPERSLTIIDAIKEQRDIEIQKNIQRGRMETEIGKGDAVNSLCLRMGADIYLTYRVKFFKNQSLGTLQARVYFEIYEAATNKSLANEVGISEHLSTSDKSMLIDQAVTNGLGKALKTVTIQWKNQLKIGVPYLISARMVSEFEDDAIWDVQDAFSGSLKKLCNRVKNKASDDTQMNYIVYVKAGKYEDADDLLYDIRKKFNAAQNIAKLVPYGAVVGKFIQVGIKEVY